MVECCTRSSPPKPAAELGPPSGDGRIGCHAHRSRISKQGEPEQTDPFAILPSSGIIALGREQAVSPVLAARGISDRRCRPKLCGPIDARDTQKECSRPRHLIIAQPVGDHRSGADRTQGRVRLRHHDAEVRPGLLDRGKVVPQAAQIVDDVGAVHRRDAQRT